MATRVQEWSWIDPAGEVKHLWNVGCFQRDCLWFIDPVYLLSGHRFRLTANGDESRIDHELEMTPKGIFRRRRDK